MEAKKAKAEGAKMSRKQKKADEAMQDQILAQETTEPGTASGNPHQIEQTLQEVLNESDSSSSSDSSRSTSPERKPGRFINQGFQAVGEGFRDVGKIGSKMVGGLGRALGTKRGHRHENSQVDGTQDRPLTAPAEEEVRGPSTDTFTHLHPNFESKEEGTVKSSEPNSPDSTTKPRLSSEKPDALKRLKSFAPKRRVSDFVSPQPFKAEGDEFPLESEHKEPVEYDLRGLYREDLVEDSQDALWRKYIKPKDRETMRLPLFKFSWWPALPLIGKKVDTIYHCRKELARLNHEIADDQAHPERFPLMNSAFIQFNHQVAAHMACQSLSHHIPRQMAPRTVEVNPQYVIWDNLTMKWYMRYVRTFGIVVAIVGLIICWGIPVSFTGALSQIKNLTDDLKWLAWLNDLPVWLISFIQGVLPPAFLAILFAILPILLRFLAEQTGTTTYGERELLVQNFYFAFVFIQLFLVVSISTGITSTLTDLLNSPTSIPTILARNLPKAANYFYSYMILQALSISSGTLLQIAAVLMLVVSRFFDTTPREKVSRVLSRPGINWGNMIPVYTNFGAIGIIYCVVSPLIMVMMLITFSLFWFTYRYQMIYVSYAKAETNGLIFPKAINQLFTGLYFMELCLIGLFFLQKTRTGELACFPQAIIMIVVLGFTIIFQVLVNRAFGPLFQYLPITFEDEAVQRDEEFQRAQNSRWQKEDDEHRSLNSVIEERERNEKRESQRLEAQDRRMSKAYSRTNSYEMSKLDTKPPSDAAAESPERSRKAWADRSRSRSHSHHAHGKKRKDKNPIDLLTNALRNGIDDATKPIRDIEAQVMPSANLFDDIDDTLEDIEPEARQKLIKRSFQHPATRAIQPAVWIPHDHLGIARDEIQHTSAFSSKIWISSQNARLNASGVVMYRGLPPDRDPFENIEV